MFAAADVFSSRALSHVCFKEQQPCLLSTQTARHSDYSCSSCYSTSAHVLLEVFRMTHILIVDDDNAIRDTLREALEDEGYEVHEAANGIACLEKLRASQEGMVVLLDQL